MRQARAIWVAECSELTKAPDTRVFDGHLPRRDAVRARQSSVSDTMVLLSGGTDQRLRGQATRRHYSESISERVVYDAVAAARESMYHLKRLIA